MKKSQPENPEIRGRSHPLDLIGSLFLLEKVKEGKGVRLLCLSF